MDSDEDDKMGTSLEKYFTGQDKVLPVSAQVVRGFSGWKEQESLKEGSRILLVGVQSSQMVRMTDETGVDFEESLPFQRCKFMVLQQNKPWLDGKEYASVAEVMELPADRRPEYVRTQRGMLFSAEEGLSTDEILHVTGELEVNEEAQDCAAWYRLASTGDERSKDIVDRKRTKVLLPLVDLHDSGACFDTILDAKKYELQEIVDQVQEKQLTFPMRVKPVDIQAAEGEPPLALSHYTIAGMNDALWLVGLDLASGTFFRIPSSMKTRIKVDESELRSSDLKQCMHAVLESLADSELRIVGPQAEVSLSAKCSAVNTPMLPPRSPPEGMQSVDDIDTDTAESKVPSEDSARKSNGFPVVSPSNMKNWRRQSLPAGGKSLSLGGHYHSTSAGLLPVGSQLQRVTSVRRFSTPHALDDDSLALTKPVFQPALQLGKHNVSSWSVADVAVWLESLALGGYSSTFKSELVNGDLLLQMDDDMLRDDFNITNRFHRMKLLNFIRNQS